MTNTEPAVPAEAAEVRCAQCGAGMYPNPDWPPEVRESDGSTSVSLLCSAGCGSPGRFYKWQVSRDEYEALFGPVPENLALPGDPRLLPLPPEERTLPPGPWGYFKVQPIELPDEAWQQVCPNKLFRRTTKCGAILIPAPDKVFYYDEFTSSVHLGFRCNTCRKAVLEHMVWSLTPEQHLAIFGRTLDEYRPEVPEDEEEDGAPALYSMWITADRSQHIMFASLDEFLGTPDYDLKSFPPGEWTVRHWPTGATWDMPDFLAQHAGLVDDWAKYYAQESGDYVGDGSDEEDE